MNKELMNKLYKDNGLEPSDTYKHKNYTIITRQGIEKIQAKNDIKITYEVIRCEELFAVVKAYATKGDETIETFGSALYGGFGEGTTKNHYIIEIAEKRALSRAVLKISGLYAHGMYSEDEADDFKKSKPKKELTPKEELDKDIMEGVFSK